jgi:hypothetical protein
MAYHVDVTAGPFTWSVTEGDAAAVGDLVAPLVIGWRMPDDGFYPTQPEATHATIGFIVAELDDTTTLNVGDRVSIRVQLVAAGADVFAFEGRIADLEAAPHDLGMVVSCECVALSTDPAEVPAGLTLLASAQTIWTRIAAIMPEAVMGDPDLDDDGLFGASATFAQRDPSLTNQLALIDEHLWQAPVRETIIPDNHPADVAAARSARLIVNKVDDTTTYLDPLYRGYTATPPAAFADTGAGLYGPVPDAGMPAVVDSGYVQRDARLVRAKGGAVNYVEIGGIGEPDPRPVPTVSLSSDTQLLPPNAMALAAAFYLPDEADRDGWSIDAFLLRLDRMTPTELASIGPGWLPDPDAAAAVDRIGCYINPVVVEGIQDASDPTPGRFYCGRLVEATFELGADATPTLGFRIRRGIPAPVPVYSGTAPYMTPANLATSSLAAVTVADLDPAYLVADYRLVRNPT